MPFILGVIPARGGSKGIPKKNMRQLNGIPLIKYTFDAAFSSKMLSDFIVTTDSDEIAEYSRNNGVSVPFKRPAEFSTDQALAIPTIQHAVLTYEKIKGLNIDFVVMLQPTAPLRSGFDIDSSICALLDKKVDSIISVVSVKNNHPYKMKIIKEGYLKDYQETGLENPPRQQLPPVYIVNGAVYACKRDVLINQNSFKGKSCIPYIMPDERSANIDSLVDFTIAEYFLNQKISNK